MLKQKTLIGRRLSLGLNGQNHRPSHGFGNHLIFNSYSTSRRVGYQMVLANEARSAELVTIISYLTSASGIIVLLKTPTKY